jgi:uncharacterized protein YceK
MRYLLIAIALAVLAGCATAATTENARVFYDRKYNTYYELRSDESDTRTPRTAALYDRKYNTYLPSRGSSQETAIVSR